MPISIQLPDGSRTTLEGDSFTLGIDPECQIVLPIVPGLERKHAEIKRIANRWLVQSLGDWFIQVGQSAPAHKCWLQPGDKIHLTPNGPEVLFDTPPKQSSVQQESAPRVLPPPLPRNAYEERGGPLPQA